MGPLQNLITELQNWSPRHKIETFCNHCRRKNSLNCREKVLRMYFQRRADGELLDTNVTSPNRLYTRYEVAPRPSLCLMSSAPKPRGASSTGLAQLPSRLKLISSLKPTPIAHGQPFYTAIPTAQSMTSPADWLLG